MEWWKIKSTASTEKAFSDAQLWIIHGVSARTVRGQAPLQRKWKPAGSRKSSIHFGGIADAMYAPQIYGVSCFFEDVWSVAKTNVVFFYVCACRVWQVLSYRTNYIPRSWMSGWKFGIPCKINSVERGENYCTWSCSRPVHSKASFPKGIKQRPFYFTGEIRTEKPLSSPAICSRTHLIYPSKGCQRLA